MKLRNLIVPHRAIDPYEGEYINGFSTVLQLFNEDTQEWESVPIFYSGEAANMVRPPIEDKFIAPDTKDKE